MDATGATEKKTVRAMFEDGDVTFAEPVDLEGCWRIEVTFIEREDGPFEVSPHRPERGAVPDRFDEVHRRIEGQKPGGGQIYDR